jgi:hypothetical protein
MGKEIWEFSNFELYPTPRFVIEDMLLDVELQGKTVLEPSAGFGNMADFCKENGAEVIVCEISDRLRQLLDGKYFVIESDFLDLTRDRVSHVDLIVMNPPFSKQEEHLSHAWDIAPVGCTIICLCNATMYKNSWSKKREYLKELINLHGRTEDFGECFKNAEVGTLVDVGCVYLTKEGTDEDEFTGYFDLHDYEQDTIEKSGIVKYDFVQDIVSRYVEAVSKFDEVAALSDNMRNIVMGINPHSRVSCGVMYKGDRGDLQRIERGMFKKTLRKEAWNTLFSKMDMEKFLTRGVREQINKFVERQEVVPFTVRNVYKMIYTIAGTHSGRMDKVIVEAFDLICSLSKENSSAGEGWKTNTDFTVNKKFILPSVCRWESYYRDNAIRFEVGGRLHGVMDDIVKALCQLTGTRYESIPSMTSFVEYKYHVRNIHTNEILSGYDFYGNSKNYILDKVQKLNSEETLYELLEIDNSWGQWVEWGFFRVKGHKKGTLHVEFLDEDVWLKFNQRVAEVRGWKNVLVHNKKSRNGKK